MLNETGLALHDFKRYEAAIQYFDRALQLRDNVPELHYNRGNALVALHRFERGGRELRQGDRDQGRTTRAPTTTAALPCSSSAVSTRRSRAYDKVLALQPGHPRARANRDALLKNAGGAARHAPAT